MRLSKSSFIRGLQCEKSLYLYKHHYRLKDPTPSSLQTVFNQGTNIGIVAQVGDNQAINYTRCCAM